MLAKNLQGVKVSAAEGAEYAQIVQKQLREERNDDEYDLFWNGVVTDQVLYNVSEPATTGRIRSESQLSEKLQYRAIYYEAYDNIDRAISERFDQADFLIYKDLQQVFMNAVQGMPNEEEMRRVCKTYSADVSYGNLTFQFLHD